jgi:DUF4097 and DUF4098 domain-containing protein YvlB
METTMMTLSSRAVLILSAALLAAPAIATDGRPVDERRPLKADAELRVSNVAGEVQVEAWDRNELHLTGELAPEVEQLVIEGGESSLRIEVKLPRNTRRSAHAQLRLKVPAGVSLRVETVSADIGVRGVRGPVDVEAVSGDVHLDVASAKVEARSVSGDLTLVAPAGEARVASVSGDVTVRGARGELRGESVSGDIRVQAGALRRLELETVSGDVEVDAELAAEAEVALESLSGSVTLTLPKAPTGRLLMKSFSGDIESAWSPGPARGAREYRSDGDGRGRIRLTSHSGDVELRKK